MYIYIILILHVRYVQIISNMTTTAFRLLQMAAFFCCILQYL